VFFLNCPLGKWELLTAVAKLLPRRSETDWSDLEGSTGREEMICPSWGHRKPRGCLNELSWLTSMGTLKGTRRGRSTSTKEEQARCARSGWGERGSRQVREERPRGGGAQGSYCAVVAGGARPGLSDNRRTKEMSQG
jgi:hypothetical protein